MTDTQKRLAFFMPGLYGGGAERVMLNLAQGVAARGYSLDLVVAQAEGPFLADVPELVRLVELNSRHLNARRTLASLPALTRYLRRERPEAMLTALSRANLVALWARRLAGVDTRVILTQHQTLSVKAPHPASLHERCSLWLMKRVFPWADDYEIVIHNIPAIDSIAIIHKLILGVSGMDKYNINITILTKCQSLTSSYCDNVNPDIEFFLKWRQKNSQQSRILCAGSRRHF